MGETTARPAPAADGRARRGDARRGRDDRSRAVTDDVAALSERLQDVGLADAERLRRRIERVGRTRDPAARRAGLADVEQALAAAAARLERRRSLVPAITYPDLPVSARRDDLLAALRDAQVVVVAGATGSGKTTQLPKICLELGRGVRGLVGHTQPRRLAARTVAERVAEELGTPLGSTVGYTVRFTDRVGEDTMVKVMTDGILLAEIQRDPELRRYDTLIVDEAHERSLNIDFILGYLRSLLPRRPDLKLVITSATIDTERFARHFGDAPVVEVSGRTYPVEVRYRPLVEAAARPGDAGPPDRPDLRGDAGTPGTASGSADDDLAGDAAPAPARDQVTAVVEAVQELSAESPGDVLVFLSGEREIRDTAEALSSAGLRHTEVLPLYARLSSAEQHRVFSPHPGRRIVLATNVAETSLTVPGIRYVVDAGTARISRYSTRLKVQRLPIEPISRASADQRAGRCGRVAPGICIRLYSREDYESRPEFTDPEILRTSLAAVILQMTALGLGDVGAFPFVDPPDRRSVRDGVQLLHELGALEADSQDAASRRLTPLGRRLAQLPLDPRLGRMLLEADRNGCVRELLVVASALSIQDPRERPAEARQAADERHRRFADETSDVLAYLNLWEYLREQQKALSGSAFRRLCKAEYLHYLRVREWQDLHAQLRQVVRGLGIGVNDAPADPRRVHQSLLAGLLSHIGMRDPARQDYLGARGARFAIWPGSALARKPPQWVVAAELVETSRLWARDVARIEPEWVEPLAGHLLKRTYSEPHWEARRGSVVASEKVTLYGVPVVTARTVSYGRIDPGLSRELFLRHALVEGDWRSHHRFLADNRALLEDVEELEHRTRRRDLVVDDEALFDFYDERVPADVVSGRHFDAWWKAARRSDPDLLTFERSMLLTEEAAAVTEADYPRVERSGGVDLRLDYAFEPGTAQDGVTVEIPLAVLNRVDPDPLGWQVPGLRHELVTALIRSLPKELRRSFVPAPDTARAVLQDVGPQDGPLLDVLSAQLRRRTGVTVPPDAWDVARVPAYLRPTYRVVEEDGSVVATGEDVEELRHRLAGPMREALSRAGGGAGSGGAGGTGKQRSRPSGRAGREGGEAASGEPSPAAPGRGGAAGGAGASGGAGPLPEPGPERRGLRSWNGVGTLPRVWNGTRGGLPVTAYPALVDEGDTVAVALLATPAEQARAMRAGTRRLLRLQLPAPGRGAVEHLGTAERLALSRSPHGSVPALLEDCAACAVDSLVEEAGGPAWDALTFSALLEHTRAGMTERTADVVTVVARVLAAAAQVEAGVKGTSSLVLLPALSDLKAQLAGLVHPGFVTAAGRRRLPDVLRYLRAAARRLEKLPDDPARDRRLMEQVQQGQALLDDLVAGLPPSRREDPAVLDVRWMIEELRVSLFAQTVGTPAPVSLQRIQRAVDRLRR